MEIELIGQDRARVGEVTLKHKTPMLAMLRRLKADGLAPKTVVRVVRDQKPALEPFRAEELWDLALDEGRHGFRWRKYAPSPWAKERTP